MKIAYASDLHLEHFIYSDEIFEEFTFKFYNGCEQADILILAGDIVDYRLIDETNNKSPFDDGGRKSFRRFMGYLAHEYSHVIFVMGNHEHYLGTFQQNVEYYRSYFRSISTNIILLEKEMMDVGGLRIFGGTLWTDFGKNPMMMLSAPSYINDYRRIFSDDENDPWLKPEMILEEHRATVSALLEVKPDIVVTHHAPSELSVNVKYEHMISNVLYYSELSDVMDSIDIPVWIHGHMHDPVDYEVYGTRVLSNPCGYHASEVNVRHFKLKYMEYTENRAE